MKKILLSIIMATSFMISSAAHADVDYSLWSKVLSTYVDDQGLVNYKALKNNMNDLNVFITIIETTDISTLNPTETKNFWINAYNAITLKVVADAYPTKSIRRINFGLVWNVPRKVAQGKKSLGDIEHKILRPLGDPRIHFAINCASIGCPELPNTPFLSEQLDEQLDRETYAFLQNPQKVSLDRDTNTLHISAILDWFDEDFLAVATSIKDYVLPYLNESDRTYIQNNPVTVKFFKYDWGLNEQ